MSIFGYVGILILTTVIAGEIKYRYDKKHNKSYLRILVDEEMSKKLKWEKGDSNSESL